MDEDTVLKTAGANHVRGFDSLVLRKIIKINGLEWIRLYKF